MPSHAVAPFAPGLAHTMPEDAKSINAQPHSRGMLEDMPAEGPYAVKPQHDRTDRTEHLMAYEIRPCIRRPAAAHKIFAV